MHDVLLVEINSFHKKIIFIFFFFFSFATTKPSKKKKPKSILPSPSDKYTHASNANAVERGASEKTLVRSLDGSRVGARFFFFVRSRVSL